MEKEEVLGGSSENSQAAGKVRGLFGGGWDEVIYYSVQCFSPWAVGILECEPMNSVPLRTHRCAAQG